MRSANTRSTDSTPEKHRSMRLAVALLRRKFTRHTTALSRHRSSTNCLLFCSMATTSSTDPVTPSNTRVGWIGTGVMGHSMCSHLLKAGYSVTVFNRTLSKAQPLVHLGAQLADSPSAVASQSDVVFSIVGYPADVKSVLLDPTTGALSSLRTGGILVDMTTSEPSLAVTISEAASAKGCQSIDAPVSGGDRGAKAAKLSIFAGGDHSVITKLNPLFDLLGKTYYMGGPGKGQFAKLANQITIASTMVGLVEGLVFAYKAKLDVGLFLEAISTGGAGSKSLDLSVRIWESLCLGWHWPSSSISLSKLMGRATWAPRLLFCLLRGSIIFHSILLPNRPDAFSVG
ncbi:hypothetical protein Nepgr_005183 [Nepenthes gracilis]|uniref:3-hydroxyisobutyrate dehydrogenase n=1 Tax=Nepenthes gracilis TaxID=150966 RepID=A0AAD3XG09_NEPGR|nr:hypothetical protein Nepgr_005183 [Nepenthes gracilis]